MDCAARDYEDAGGSGSTGNVLELNTRLKTEIERLKRENAELRAQANLQEERIVHLEQKQLVVECGGEKEGIDHLRQRISSLSELNGQLAKQLLCVTDTNLALWVLLKKAVEEKTLIAEESNEQAVAVAAQRDGLKSSITKLRLQLVRIEKERSNARERVVKLENECAALKLSSEKLRAQFGCLKDQQEEASQTRRENAQLRGRLNAMEKELSLEKRTSSKLRLDLARMQKERDDAKTAAGSAQGYISRLHHRLDRHGEVIGQNVRLRNQVETERKKGAHLHKQLAIRSREDSVCAVANSAALASKLGFKKIKKDGKGHWI